MKDEEYLFRSDLREKMSIGRSARNRRTHNGRRGGVKLPSDYMTKKEIKEMSGEVKSYRLNEPMAWAEFKAMPDDIKVSYIKLLRQKYNVPGKYIAEMLGINPVSYSHEINRLGISEGKNCRGRCTPWDREGWLAWCNGVTILANPVEQAPRITKTPGNLDDIKEAGVYVSTPAPDPVPLGKTIGSIKTPEDETMIVGYSRPTRAIPDSGNMVFEGNVVDIMKTVGVLLGGANVHISITWDVLGGAENG